MINLLSMHVRTIGRKASGEKDSSTISECHPQQIAYKSQTRKRLPNGQVWWSPTQLGDQIRHLRQRDHLASSYTSSRAAAVRSIVTLLLRECNLNLSTKITERIQDVTLSVRRTAWTLRKGVRVTRNRGKGTAPDAERLTETKTHAKVISYGVPG